MLFDNNNFLFLLFSCDRNCDSIFGTHVHDRYRPKGKHKVINHVVR